MEGLDFNLDQFFSYAIQVAIAFLLTLPIAWEREKNTRSMGLRTFPLVAVASCGYVLTALGFLETDENAKARIIQGLMIGIGFIGGGAILKEGTSVRGTATAASVWATGALGAAVAYSQYEVAVLMSLVNYITLRFLTPLGQRLNHRDRTLEDEFDD